MLTGKYLVLQPSITRISDPALTVQVDAMDANAKSSFQKLRHPILISLPTAEGEEKWSNISLEYGGNILGGS